MCILSFKEKNLKILEKVFIELSRNNLTLDVKKIAESFDNQGQELVSDWINSQLPQLEAQQLLRIEFQKKEQANLEVVLENLSRNPNLNSDGGFSNGLNLAEQAIAQAYISQSYELLSAINSRSPIDKQAINKIAKTFIDPKDTLLNNSEKMK